jgi:type II secretory pathway pseudopilin PulG
MNGNAGQANHWAVRFRPHFLAGEGPLRPFARAGAGLLAPSPLGGEGWGSAPEPEGSDWGWGRPHTPRPSPPPQGGRGPEVGGKGREVGGRGARRLVRPAFTAIEMAIALALLATATVLVAQVATTSLAERTRTAERLAAIEETANVLEAARTRPWADLTPEWAAAQRLPDELANRLRQAVFTVRVEPEPDRLRVKRVTVELSWKHSDGAQARTARTVALFADRTAGGGS